MSKTTKRAALFLDRDGIVNRERGYTWRVEDWELEPGILDIATWATENGYPMIVITNQGGIAKGLYTISELEILHTHMRAVFAQNGTPLTDVFYCPHHPETGICLCRKPHSLMLERAAALYNIDLSKSYFLGDQARDMAAGARAGVQRVYVGRDKNVEAEYSFTSLQIVWLWLRTLRKNV